MCIICVSKPGVRQPDENTIRTMFYRNPHGAGYMFARDGRVEIRKGFMRLDEYLRAIREERFTAADSVVYHFRISTQAGVNPEMTHPFPLSNQPARLRRLDQSCRIGVAHNSVIRLTSDPDNERYSDTAIFIADYLSQILRTRADLRDRLDGARDVGRVGQDDGAGAGTDEPVERVQTEGPLPVAGDAIERHARL